MYKYKPRLAGTCVFTYAILERDTERQRKAVSIMPRLATPASLSQLLRSAAHHCDTNTSRYTTVLGRTVYIESCAVRGKNAQIFF